MSATLAVEIVSAYLGGCPVVESEGRQYPVEILYEPRPETAALAAGGCAAAERLLDATRRRFARVPARIAGNPPDGAASGALAAERGLAVLPLYGDLPAEQQDAALLPLDRRKVVLATNVAETSVTVEGVAGVVDTGLARTLTFRPRRGPGPAAADADLAGLGRQRGRPGGTDAAGGLCAACGAHASHLGRPEQTEPEIRRVDLAGAVLQLMGLGETDVSRFPWLEPPPAATVATGVDAAAATRSGGRTGRDVPRPDIGPSAGPPPAGPLARRRAALGRPDRAALAAALLGERDPFARERDAAGAAARSLSDVLDRIEALEEFERTGRCSSVVGTLNHGAARFILRARDQLVRSLHQEMRRHGISANDVLPDEALLRSLLAAFPDRLARRRRAGSRRGVMVGGRGVRLAPSSGVTDPEFFLCIDVDASRTESLVRQASAVEREWLPPDRIRTAVEVAFDAEAERVTARRRVRFEDLILEETQASAPDDAEAAHVLAAASAERLDRVLPPDDSPTGLYRTRVRCLREWMPELGLPALDDTDLRGSSGMVMRGPAVVRGAAGRRLAGGAARPADACAAASGRARGAGAVGRAERQSDRAEI